MNNKNEEPIIKARADYRLAVDVANDRGLVDVEKERFIANYLFERLAIAYGGAGFGDGNEGEGI